MFPGTFPSMQKNNNREREALYIVISRDPQAEKKFKDWQQSNPSVAAEIAGSRLKLFDFRSLSVFQITWTGNWNQISIWDTWAKRHLSLQ